MSQATPAPAPPTDQDARLLRQLRPARLVWPVLIGLGLFASRYRRLV